MSDNFIRHLISFIGTLIVLLAYFSGYISGSNGWWWTAIGMLIFYVIVFKLVEA
ncbi:MAG: hypothetical protein GF349_01565 [Candidatus Magasanikbacteria bacterium]|nr:hypothetical protein [Candidatus Magasanikbacteria bacterium]